MLPAVCPIAARLAIASHTETRRRAITVAMAATPVVHAAIGRLQLATCADQHDEAGMHWGLDKDGRLRHHLGPADLRGLAHAKVAKLVDALDSGSSAFTGMWVQVPPFALPFILRHCLVAILAVAATAGCARSEGEQLVRDSLTPVHEAVRLLREAHGDDRVLLESVMQWRAVHGQEVKAVRERAERLLPTLPPDERLRLETQARNEAEPLMAQIIELSNGFRDPPTVQRWLRPMLVPMRPAGIHGPPSWLPEVPPLPGLPESNTSHAY